jgi:hypothetical protein
MSPERARGAKVSREWPLLTSGTQRLESAPSPPVRRTEEPKTEGWGAVNFTHSSAELTDVGGDESRVKQRVHFGSSPVIAAKGIAAPVRLQTEPQAVMPGNV